MCPYLSVKTNSVAAGLVTDRETNRYTEQLPYPSCTCIPRVEIFCMVVCTVVVCFYLIWPSYRRKQGTRDEEEGFKEKLDSSSVKTKGEIRYMVIVYYIHIVLQWQFTVKSHYSTHFYP